MLCGVLGLDRCLVITCSHILNTWCWEKAESRKVVSTSYIHRNQSFHQPQHSRVGVPKVFDKDLHAQDDTNRGDGEYQPRDQIAQDQSLL